MDQSGLLDKSGWAKMKSPKPRLEIDAFKINKIVVGPNYVDRTNFLRGPLDKVSSVRIHKSSNKP